MVEPVDGIEQALAQHFLAELLEGAQQVKGRGVVIVRDGIQGLAQVASGTGHTFSSFITNGQAL